MKYLFHASTFFTFVCEASFFVLLCGCARVQNTKRAKKNNNKTQNGKYKSYNDTKKKLRTVFELLHKRFLPISGAKRHEFPINGNPFGPGISEYGRICGCFVTSLSVTISFGVATPFGYILIAEENAVRFTSELVAVRVPISICSCSFFKYVQFRWFLFIFRAMLFDC